MCSIAQRGPLAVLRLGVLGFGSPEWGRSTSSRVKVCCTTVIRPGYMELAVGSAPTTHSLQGNCSTN